MISQTTSPAAATAAREAGHVHRPAGSAIDVAIRPGKVLRALLACIAVLIVGGLLAAVAELEFGLTSLFGLVRLLDLDREQTFAAYFSSLQLLAAAALLAAIAAAERDRGDRMALRWALLALGFAWMAVDEAVALHELMNRPMRQLLGEDMATAWLIPAAAILVVVAVFYVPFLLALPRRFALMFAGSGAVFLFGAVGLETLVGSLLERYGQASWPYKLEVAAEEACEMIGIALFVYSLLAYLVHLGFSLRLRLAQGDHRGGDAA